MDKEIIKKITLFLKKIEKNISIERAIYLVKKEFVELKNVSLFSFISKFENIRIPEDSLKNKIHKIKMHLLKHKKDIPSKRSFLKLNSKLKNGKI